MAADDRTAMPETFFPAPCPQRGRQRPVVDADGEVLLQYKPFYAAERWFAYRFSAWNEAKAWFVMTLVVLFFYFGGPGIVTEAIIRSLAAGSFQGTAGAAALSAAALNQAILSWTLGLLGALLTLAFGLYHLQPTHIGVSTQGLRWRWRRRWVEGGGPLLPWDSVQAVNLLKPPGKTSMQDWWVCFVGGEDQRLKVKLGAIPFSEERARLLEAIEAWAPQATRDPQLLEVLSPPQEHSYTELWLKALSAPPKRERLTPLKEGATLEEGRYRVIGQLGVGGQGTAYLACDQGPDADNGNARRPRNRPSENGSGAGAAGTVGEVVLKESILPVYVDVNVRKEALERFQQEAAMLSRLDHPRIVKLRDFFVEDHRSYLVLEHIDGMSLRQAVEMRGPFPESEVRELALQMCSILSYLHGLTPPVVHRDFTPDNLILSSQGTLKLVDFNVAQQTECTTTGTVVGKHAYIPPEQFRGKPTTRSDIYALGATLYYLLVGKDPEPITASHPSRAQGPHASRVSVELDGIVARATAVDAARRYGRVEELQADLVP